MFIKRNIADLIKSGAQQVPVVAVIGPRQSGKSTLVKELFPDYIYLDMQDDELYNFANTDPKGFLNTYQDAKGVIFDEAQYAPKLFSQIKVEVDKDSRPGRYILSGSQNFLLHEKINESLAGRVYFYKLLPLSIPELTSAHLLQHRIEDQICKGFYPRVYQPNMKAAEYYENYIFTYVERDIRTIKNIDNILTFKKFMQLCALRIGTTLNYTDLATNCGINVATARAWLALLETSFILFLMPSYHENLGKRVTKSPKLYFYDVGLAAALIGLNEETLIKKRDLFGGLFENMVIVDLMKQFYARGIHHAFSFYRDTNQNEIDLIIETGGQTIPVEVKAAETIQSSFFDTALWLKEQSKEIAEPVVVYGGSHAQKRSQGSVVSWQELAKVYEKLL